MGIQYILTQVNNNTSSSYIVDCLDDKMIVSDFIDHRRTIEKEFKTWEQVCEWIIDNEAKNVKEKIEKKEKIKKKEKEEKIKKKDKIEKEEKIKKKDKEIKSVDKKEMSPGVRNRYYNPRIDKKKGKFVKR